MPLRLWSLKNFLIAGFLTALLILGLLWSFPGKAPTHPVFHRVSSTPHHAVKPPSRLDHQPGGAPLAPDVDWIPLGLMIPVTSLLPTSISTAKNSLSDAKGNLALTASSAISSTVLSTSNATSTISPSVSSPSSFREVSSITTYLSPSKSSASNVSKAASSESHHYLKPQGQFQTTATSSTSTASSTSESSPSSSSHTSTPTLGPTSTSGAHGATPTESGWHEWPQPFKTQVWQDQCGIVSLDALSKTVLSASDFDLASTPVFVTFHDGQLVSSDSTFEVSSGFCTFIIVPQPTTASNISKNPEIPGWGPDAMHASVKSDDVWLIFKHPVYIGNFSSITASGPKIDLARSPPLTFAAYAQAYTLNQPGAYSLQGGIEFQSYDWVMQADDVNVYTMTQTTLLPYDVLDIPISVSSSLAPPIIVTGAPISRPTTACHTSGANDLHGRWYLASSFGPGGSQSALNGAAELDFAGHSNVIDEFGWTFAPDACSLTYFSRDDYHTCLGGRNMAFHADSNSRRLLKALMAGGTDAWCASPFDTVCQCQDTWERSIFDSTGKAINNTHYFSETQLEEAVTFGNGSRAYFDMNGGLVRPNYNHQWSRFFQRSSFAADSLTDSRVRASGGQMDVVHLSFIGWDVGYAAEPAVEWANEWTGVPALRRAVREGYPRGTKVVHRLANAPCCGNYSKRLRYNIPRYELYNAIWRSYLEQDEQAGDIMVHDASVLEGRPDLEMFGGTGCPMTHLRASHVRIEAMMWMNAVCTKDGGAGAQAKMRTDWGLWSRSGDLEAGDEIPWRQEKQAAGKA